VARRRRRPEAPDQGRLVADARVRAGRRRGAARLRAGALLARDAGRRGRRARRRVRGRPGPSVARRRGDVPREGPRVDARPPALRRAAPPASRGRRLRRDGLGHPARPRPRRVPPAEPPPRRAVPVGAAAHHPDDGRRRPARARRRRRDGQRRERDRLGPLHLPLQHDEEPRRDGVRGAEPRGAAGRPPARRTTARRPARPSKRRGPRGGDRLRRAPTDARVAGG
jgi:hypothetical protein